MEITIRPIHRDDVDDVYDACRDGDMARYMPDFPHPYTFADAEWYVDAARRWWREGSSFPFAIVGADDRLVGVVDVRAPDEDGAASCGYWVRADLRGKGIATKALQLLVAEAEARGVQRLWLTTHPDNVASRRAAEKAGFVQAGRSAEHPPMRDGRTYSVIYELRRNSTSEPIGR